MVGALDQLLDVWSELPPRGQFHPLDDDALGIGNLRSGLVPLTPYPFSGDLRSAKVWILMRNPGVGAHDHLQEGEDNFAELLGRNLRQDFGPYPFLHLDPVIENTDASNYWWRKRNFRKLANQIAELTGKHPSEVRSALAQNVAILELCAYRRSTFSTKMCELPTVKLARAALREALAQAREDGNRAFVVPWNPSVWQLNDFLSAPFVRNAPAQSFTFRIGAKTGFGEMIAKYAFDLDLP